MRGLKGKSVAEAINHPNCPDEKGRVYCRVEHDVLEWDDLECLQCPICAGSIQGMGVEYTEINFQQKISIITRELKLLKTLLFLERKRSKKNFYAKLRFADNLDCY